MQIDVLKWMIEQEEIVGFPDVESEGRRIKKELTDLLSEIKSGQLPKFHVDDKEVFYPPCAMQKW